MDVGASADYRLCRSDLRRWIRFRLSCPTCKQSTTACMPNQKRPRRSTPSPVIKSHRSRRRTLCNFLNRASGYECSRPSCILPTPKSTSFHGSLPTYMPKHHHHHEGCSLPTTRAGAPLNRAPLVLMRCYPPMSGTSVKYLYPHSKRAWDRRQLLAPLPAR